MKKEKYLENSILDTKGQCLLNINNVRYVEPITNTNGEWYWTMSYDSGFDAYDAGLNYLQNNEIEGTDVYIIHYPDGKMIQLLKKEKNIHTSPPCGYKNNIFFTRVVFDKKLIQIMKYNPLCQDISLVDTITLKSIKECYNMFFFKEPLMLTCHMNKKFKILWPERRKYKVHHAESFVYRENDHLVFEKDYDDRDEIIVRDYLSGTVVEKIKDTRIQIMPNGDKWFLMLRM